jgi:hypothetical protein
MKNLYNSNKKLVKNSLKKLTLLLLVLYVVVCHAITVTNYYYIWCSVMINEIFSTCFGSIICFIGKFYFKNIFKIVILNYLWGTVWELSLHDRFFFQIMNYQSFWNNQVYLYELFFHGMQVQTKIVKFQITIEFEINQDLLCVCVCAWYMHVLHTNVTWRTPSLRTLTYYKFFFF